MSILSKFAEDFLEGWATCLYLLYLWRLNTLLEGTAEWEEANQDIFPGARVEFWYVLNPDYFSEACNWGKAPWSSQIGG